MSNKILDYYNKQQSEYVVWQIVDSSGTWKVDIEKNTEKVITAIHMAIKSIGFYEWVFNPKYGVFEAFGKIHGLYILDILDADEDGYLKVVEPPSEIIKILSKLIKISEEK